MRDGDQPRCAYAMDALKRSMAWDEEVYGREYDLDRFMIVAVDDFNMGAMENKGLNVFNSKYVLASPETATDADYKSIEAIIAHEYFHNWTGNRITCRDWFQLCLKEGLTVFRDQQFSADMRSAGRQAHRGRASACAPQQFREDAGPLAHPVRPEEYVEINNFYTATVYEKGAELVGMLRRLVGPETYAARARPLLRAPRRRGGHHRGLARASSRTSPGRDLSPVPALVPPGRHAAASRAEEDWRDGRYTLRLSQSTPPTPGQPDKRPLVIPVAYGLLARDGRTLAEGVIELTEAAAETAWDLPERPAASLLRGFSAPVILERAADADERAVLLAHDTDPFNRWEAGRASALALLTRMAEAPDAEPDPDFLAAMAAVADDPTLDPAFKALALGLPGEEETIAHMAAGRPHPGSARRPPRPPRARARARRGARRPAGGALRRRTPSPAPTPPTPPRPARRALRARALALLCARDGDAAPPRRSSSPQPTT